MSNNQCVSEKMLKLGNFPILSEKDTLKKALDEMTSHGIGIVCLVNNDGELVGILTDGDLRRLLLTRQDPLPALLVSPALNFGNLKPTTIRPETTILEGNQILGRLRVWDLPILNSESKLVGLFHLEIS